VPFKNLRVDLVSGAVARPIVRLDRDPVTDAVRYQAQRCRDLKNAGSAHSGDDGEYWIARSSRATTGECGPRAAETNPTNEPHRFIPRTRTGVVPRTPPGVIARLDRATQ
jgi:hypothetical protein